MRCKGHLKSCQFFLTISIYQHSYVTEYLKYIKPLSIIVTPKNLLKTCKLFHFGQSQQNQCLMNDMLNFCNKDHPIYRTLLTIRERTVYFYQSKNAKEIHRLGMLRVTEQCHITSYLPECNRLRKECHFFGSGCLFQGLIYLISQYLGWELFQGGSYSSGSLFESLQYTLGAIKMYVTQVSRYF